MDGGIQEDWVRTYDLKKMGRTDNNTLHSKVRLFLPSVRSHGKSRNDKFRFKNARINLLGGEEAYAKQKPSSSEKVPGKW